MGNAVYRKIPSGLVRENRSISLIHIEPETGYVWEKPSDWPDISDVPDGHIHMLLCDAADTYVCLDVECSTGNFYVDWGDGEVESFAMSTRVRHQYVTGAGAPCSLGYTTFVLRIYPADGVLTRCRPYYPHLIGSTPTHNFPSLWVVDAATDAWVSSGRIADSAASPLLECYIMKIPKTRTGVNFFEIFKGCKSLQYVEVRTDGGNSTNWSFMFYLSPALRKVKIETASLTLTSAAYMFGGCTSLEVVEGLGYLSVARNITNMFNNCGIYEADLSSFTIADESNGRNQIFSGCSRLRKVTLPTSFGAPAGTQVFRGCVSLTGEGSVFDALSSAIDLTEVFAGSGLTNTDCLPSFPNATNITKMFEGCPSLGRVALSLSSVTTATNAFYGCAMLKTVDITLPSVTTAASMFHNCITLENVELTGFALCATATNMFYGCYLLKNVSHPTFGSSLTGTVAMTGMYYGNNIFLQSINLSMVTRWNRLNPLQFSGCSSCHSFTFPASITWSSAAVANIGLDGFGFTKTELETLFSGLPNVPVAGANRLILGTCPGLVTIEKTIVLSSGSAIVTCSPYGFTTGLVVGGYLFYQSATYFGTANPRIEEIISITQFRVSIPATYTGAMYNARFTTNGLDVSLANAEGWYLA